MENPVTRRLRPVILAALHAGEPRPQGVPRKRWQREKRRLVCRHCKNTGLIPGVFVFYYRRCKCGAKLKR